MQVRKIRMSLQNKIVVATFDEEGVLDTVLDEKAGKLLVSTTPIVRRILANTHEVYLRKPFARGESPVYL